jgi:hypothetical protein
MDRNFNINEDLSNILTTPSDVSNVINNLQIVGNVIDTTLNRSSNIASSTKITPPPGIRINGKYPERNYITFDTSLLSNVTPYSSNIFTPISNRISFPNNNIVSDNQPPPTTVGNNNGSGVGNVGFEQFGGGGPAGAGNNLGGVAITSGGGGPVGGGGGGSRLGGL